MGRGKVELKRIADKSSRQVSFSKRRNGLMKKSQELAVLCDVDVAVFVFSGGGRLYEFSTGDRMTEILTRYERIKKKKGQSSININKNLASEQRDVRLIDQLIEMIQRRLEKDRIEQLDITGFNQLEQQLASFLQHVRTRETEVMMEDLKALKDKEMKLKEERKLLMEEIKAARTNETNHDSSDAAQPQLPMMDTQMLITSDFEKAKSSI